MPLDSIRIVLSRPTHPGNIGAATRAMKNMGLRELLLVAPEKFPHPEAVARAVDAADILERARICVTLEQALGDCRLVIGTSARNRRIGWPTLMPRECAQRLVVAAAQGPVALVFGQERTGLTNEELDRCQYVVTIPTSPEYSSLNLASAVQILAYEIFLASIVGGVRNDEVRDEPLATAGELQLFYEHLEQVLAQTGFLDPSNPRLLMRRLVRLFGRTELDRNELNILRGILTSVQQYCDRRSG
jgi:tRNA (cytidine32/uridine32-2'-O)-methyltransferase